MPRESKKAKVERAVEVCRRLDEKYGPVECFLDHTNPFRLVISVLLSAQTTDAQVNRVTPELFRRFPTPEAMAAASPEEVAKIIRSLGFYKTKARHCVEAAQAIVADFGGEVPHTMAELTSLPGVGRKTANIVLNVGFGIVEGIAVDTHVNRIAHRLGRAPRRTRGSRSRPSRTFSPSCRASCGGRSTTSGSATGATPAPRERPSAMGACSRTYARARTVSREAP